MNDKESIRKTPLVAFDTLNPVNRLLSILCFSTLIRKNKRLIVASSLKPTLAMIAAIIAIVLIVIYEIVQRYMNSVQKTTNIRFRDSRTTFFIWGFTQYIIDAGYAYKYGGRTYLCYFKLYDHFDKVFGMKYNTIIKTKVIKLTIILNLVVVLSSIFLFCKWILCIGHCKVTYSEFFKDMMAVLLFFINNFPLTEFCSHIIQIEYRLKIIKDILQDLHYLTNKRFSESEVVRNKDCSYSSKSTETTNKPDIPTNNLMYNNNVINTKWLKKCYLFLIEENNYLNKLFGVRVSNCFFKSRIKLFWFL